MIADGARDSPNDARSETRWLPYFTGRILRRMLDPPSKSQVNKAGRTLRLWLRGDDPFPGSEITDAYDVVLRFHAAHQAPLAKANMGLRSVVQTTGCERIQVSQRLKRVPTLLNKLTRPVAGFS